MLRALIIKEFLQIRRNPFLPRFILVFPVVIMLVIPWITTLDVQHIRVTVVDDDRSSLSQRIVADMDASAYITFESYAAGYDEALDKLERVGTDVIVEIPRGLEKSRVVGAGDKIAVSANAVNAIKGMLGMQYVTQSMGQSIAEMAGEKGWQALTEFVVVQNRYNPTMNYRYYMIPAITIMLLIILCGFLPSLSLVSEKEKGTLEQINVTPVSRLIFTLSKLIPYWIIGLVVLSVAMLVARLVYGLVPAGSLLTLYSGALLFILSISGLGVTIANRSDRMQQTMFVMFFFMIIFILMSGLLTPISSMPQWAQQLTVLFPPRYFIEIMRSVYLCGTSFTELLPQLVSLAAFATLLNILAAVSYTKQE